MSNLKTRQQVRAEKRHARKVRNLFKTGLETLEIPTVVIENHLTPTEGFLYQVSLGTYGGHDARFDQHRI